VADLFKPRRTGWREHPLACVVLEFCARYCDERFGEQWHLSPEQSLFLHGERTVIPDQLVVHSPKATNNDIKLLFGTTLYDLKVAEMPATAALTVRDGLRLFSPAAALVRVPESFFQLYPLETQVVMASLADASDLLRLLLNGGHSAKAGYLAKAFRQTGRGELADEIVRAMKGADTMCERAVHLKPDRYSASRAVPPRRW